MARLMSEVTMIPIAEILRDTVGSCDFGMIARRYGGDSTAFWQDIITTKAKDTGFGHLVDSILEFGFLPGSAIGYAEGYINEGHHRLVAAILLGLDEIPVTECGRGTPHPGGGGELVAHTNICDPYPIEVAA